MGIKDIFPAKASFDKKDKVQIIVEFEELKEAKTYFFIYSIYHLSDRIYTKKLDINPSVKEIRIDIDNVIGEGDMIGYGFEAELYEEGQVISFSNSSFDVLKSCNYAPRYGFLSDFFIKDLGDEEDLKIMNKFHLNVVQFYDWMYRHHDLIPQENVFIDPLGRELSLDVVKEKMNISHKYGMKNLAYGAVYAAGPEFYNKNKDMALYDNTGKPIGFDGFLYVMDISKYNPWRRHIINEFKKAIEIGFDGIHMDQYGFPKEAVSIIEDKKTIRSLREDFPDFINDVKKSLKNSFGDVIVAFNSVNNWPVDTVSKADADCVYIEVWPPNDTYQDLYNIITNAKRYAPLKQVVLAAYIKPFSKDLNVEIEHAQNTAIMAMAVIFASGAFHLLLGEKYGVLNDPYFPKYRELNDKKSIKELRNYYDFIVRYEELLYDFSIVDTTMTCTGGINGEYIFEGAKFSPKAETDKVWTLITEKLGYKIINLVNFTGIENMNWNETKTKRPETIKDIEVTALIVDDIEGIYLASPDFNDGKSIELDFEYVPHGQGKAIRFNVPKLFVWDLIYIVLKK
ncbi:dextranase [Caloramator quimbayensis]|uniref:Dextranase n=1 Tax=Caloramator quimbayensis TaxID=1147123 RepID=A0A1T4XU33_9CLOT|nr:glycoside hydrolase family 66 protein [Caloramator quimbayensis]SKA93047.1 dextranase [Caloramator quimbayensis]